MDWHRRRGAKFAPVCSYRGHPVPSGNEHEARRCRVEITEVGIVLPLIWPKRVLCKEQYDGQKAQKIAHIENTTHKGIERDAPGGPKLKAEGGSALGW